MKIKSWQLLICLIITLLVMIGCAGSPNKPKGGITQGDYTYLREKISWMIEDHMDDDDVVGMSIAVIDGQKTIWEAGFGYADRENEIPATPETVYEAGSISKVFTATAVMQLVEAGQVELDKPLTLYLPSFNIKPPLRNPDDWHIEQITPRTILTHHSGIPGDFHNFWVSEKKRPFQDVTLMMHEQHARWPVNKVLTYSNNGIAILGHMVEQVGGMPFVEYMDQNILKPAGMNASSFSLENNGLDNISKGYREGELQERKYLNLIPAGSLRTNVRDLSAFAKLMMSDEVGLISRQTIDEMWSRQNSEIALDYDTEIGLAWFPGTLPDVGHVVGHGGGTHYFRSRLMISPEYKLAIIVLTNSSEGNPHKIVEEALKLAIETKKGLVAEVEPDSRDADISRENENISQFEGHYQTDHGHYYFEPAGTRINVFGGRPAQLRPNGKGGFSAYVKLLKIFWYRSRWVRDMNFYFEQVDGEDVIIMEKKGKRHRIGVRVNQTSIPDSWIQRLGKYKPLDEDADYIAWLEIEHDILRLAFQGSKSSYKYAYALEAIDNNSAISLGLGRGLGKIIEVVDDSEHITLDYAGLKLQRENHSN